MKCKQNTVGSKKGTGEWWNKNMKLKRLLQGHKKDDNGIIYGNCKHFNAFLLTFMKVCENFFSQCLQKFLKEFLHIFVGEIILLTW